MAGVILCMLFGDRYYFGFRVIPVKQQWLVWTCACCLSIGSFFSSLSLLQSDASKAATAGVDPCMLFGDSYSFGFKVTRRYSPLRGLYF